MAVITVILVPNPFSHNDFIGQFIGVRPFGDGGMGVDGEPDKDRSTNDRSPDEEISGSPLNHKKPPFQSRETQFDKVILLLQWP